MSATRKLRLWLVRETPAARLYSKLPPSRSPGQGDQVWIPKSQIEHTSKLVAADQTEHTITIPEWLADEKNL